MDSPTGRCTCFVFLFSLMLFTGANAQPVKCATPKSTEGQCIHLDDCPLLLNMSNTDPLTTDIITYLRRSQCGYTELASSVCCPVSSKYMPFTLPTKHINRTHVVTLKDRFKPDAGLPGLDICGKQTFENKIFDGQITGIDEFPWMALLEYKKKSPINGHGFACGGALITDRYVLTAAHCASGQNEQALGGLINVRLGEHNIETEKDCDAVYETDCADAPLNLAIEKKIIHPQYDEDNIDQTNDIALLKLAESVSFSDFVRPICLSTKLPPTVHAPGHIQYVAGWGYTEFKRTSPVKLKLQVPLVDTSKCANKYKPFGIRLGKRQICAGGERNKDSCSGDSGGPLMVQAISKSTGVTWYMTGVVSVGPTPCAANGIPGIYTKVYDYMDWILENIKS